MFARLSFRQFVDAFLEFSHLGASGFGLCLLTGLEQVTDLSAGRILLRLEVVHFFLGGAALQIEVEDAVEQRGSIQPALGKGRLNGISIVAKGL